MSLIPNSWEIASLVCKLFLYFGAASIVGGSLCLYLYNDGTRRTVLGNIRYITLGAFVGFQGALFNFFIQIGMVMGSGIPGMFDWGMASIFLDTQLGDTTFFRLAGFVLVFVAGLFYLHRLATMDRPPTQAFYKLLNTINLVAFLLIVFSFRFSGHVSVLSPIAKLAIALHFFAFAAWIGALIPLHRLTYVDNLDFLQRSMKRFGDNAIVIVLVLIIAGVLMLLELFHSLAEIFTTPYGIALLVKLLLVTGILAIAAINKFRLTPAIQSERGVLVLRRSIAIESIVAVLILIVTSYFSTIVGPADHQM
ncbi:MAG: CopD family protein [Gammaproteobacteria bacterium]|nr:CopD family protein [Gammaproteobacteria bacterium]MDD9894314.1 CopD family protein [Gammaproteobacteria bacterium]MDD9958145.1 CopD family protein [Gammaproteobacteria bacterium]